MVMHIAAIVVWVILVNAIGFWLNRTKLKEVAFPMPIILMACSVLLVSIWGIILNPVHSFAEFVQNFTSYGLVRGLAYAVLATESYEIVHEFAKRKPQWFAVLKACLSVFKKKEKKNG